jgi:hypothetical protein
MGQDRPIPPAWFTPLLQIAQNPLGNPRIIAVWSVVGHHCNKPVTLAAGFPNIRHLGYHHTN